MTMPGQDDDEVPATDVEDAVGEDAVDEPLPSERARDEGQGGRPGLG